MKVFWAILVTAILAGGLAGGGVYYFINQKATTDKTALQDQADELTTEVATYKSKLADATASTTSNGAVTTTPATVTDTDKATVTTALTNFLTAKETRGLTNAKPYMTDAFYAKWDQETFAGTSSPSMSRFEITAINAKIVNSTYTATTKLYYSLQNVESGYFPNTFEIIKVGTKYLVNSETEGKWVEL